MQQERPTELKSEVRAGRSVGQDMIKISGAIINGAKVTMSLLQTKYWPGTTPVFDFPNSISGGGTDMFEVQGPPDDVQAGAVYCDAVAQWVIAFNYPAEKIYVEAGPAYTEVDWNTIASKLDASTSSASYKDPVTGATATSYISCCSICAGFRYG